MIFAVTSFKMWLDIFQESCKLLESVFKLFISVYGNKLQITFQLPPPSKYLSDPAEKAGSSPFTKSFVWLAENMLFWRDRRTNGILGEICAPCHSYISIIEWAPTSYSGNNYLFFHPPRPGTLDSGAAGFCLQCWRFSCSTTIRSLWVWSTCRPFVNFIVCSELKGTVWGGSSQMLWA